eukprot:204193-Pelagomonas_calceolata.AAC.12
MRGLKELALALTILPYSNTFRYYGMLFDERINLHNAAEEALKPCLAGMAHVHTFAINTRLLTAFMPTYGSVRRMSSQQECMQVRSGPLHVFNRGPRWIIAFRNGF